MFYISQNTKFLFLFISLGAYIYDLAILHVLFVLIGHRTGLYLLVTLWFAF